LGIKQARMRAGVENIVRSRGGTAERTVSVRDIVIPDVPELTTDQIDELWITSAHQLHADVTRLLGELCDGREPSRDLFIPNYWKAASRLPDETGLPLLELWYLAHDLGKETMHADLDRFRVTRTGVPGMQYYATPRNAQPDACT
jgi:hypothetical protein